MRKRTGRSRTCSRRPGTASRPGRCAVTGPFDHGGHVPLRWCRHSRLPAGSPGPPSVCPWLAAVGGRGYEEAAHRRRLGGHGDRAVSRPGQRQHARAVPRPAACLRERQRPVDSLPGPGGAAGAADRRGEHLGGRRPVRVGWLQQRDAADHQRPQRARPVHGGVPGQPAPALRRLQQGHAACSRRRGHRDPGGQAAPGGREHRRGPDGVRDQTCASRPVRARAPARRAARPADRHTC